MDRVSAGLVIFTLISQSSMCPTFHLFALFAVVFPINGSPNLDASVTPTLDNGLALLGLLVFLVVLKVNLVLLFCLLVVVLACSLY